jgi:hypothetical protein
MAQLPAEQVGVALAKLQAWPHEPQLFLSVVVLTSQPLEAVPSQSA